MQIKLTVSEENVEILLTILNNLKSGLITNIEKNDKSRVSTEYQPKSKVIYEHESGTHDTTGKYSASAYREKLKRK
ncbi:hypothetical protein JHD49_11255 [Sulfurimonas sp. SAG-AH-194-C21]|nr:hypothetical protein [Sulfurimonas sp. SAG-AH-194-C21]MDF1884518.1 hypothetical protein [Sulfurimonas sp. SAG-AH-194-C21]